MKRRLVQAFLLAHPVAFRAKFGQEMAELYLEMFDGNGPRLVGDLLWSLCLQWIRVAMREPGCATPLTTSGAQYLDLGVESPGMLRLLQSVFLIALAVGGLWVANGAPGLARS